MNSCYKGANAVMRLTILGNNGPYPAPGGATGVQAALWTAAFVLLAAFPLIFDAKEAIQWRASRSRT